MQDPAPDRPRFYTRPATLAAVGALAVYAVVCLFFLTDGAWHPEWDGAYYLATGQSLAEGNGYCFQGTPFHVRPPGLPWLLSFFIDGEGFDPHHVNLLLSLFAVAGIAAIWSAVRPIHGAAVAFATALLVATCPLYLRYLNFVLTEYPSLTFAFAGLALLQHAGKAERRWWAWSIAGALCLVAAMYLRTVFVLALPGVFLLELLRGKGWMRLSGVLPVALTVLLFLPWISYASDAAAAAELPVEQDLLHDYSTAMFHVDAGDPDSPLVDFEGWKTRVVSNGKGLVTVVAASCVPLGPPSFLLRWGLAAFVMIGFLIALRRRGPTLLQWLFVAYVGLVLTYFAFDPRLVMPLVPFVYLYLITFLVAVGKGIQIRSQDSFDRLPSPQRGGKAVKTVLTPYLLSAAVLLFLVSANVVFLARNFERESSHAADVRKIANWITRRTSVDSVILCNQAPFFVLLTGRETYTYRFVRTPEILTKYDIDYVVFDQPSTPQLVELVRAQEKARFTINLPSGRKVRVVKVSE